MSSIYSLVALEGLSQLALNALSPQSAIRSIGPITADVTVEEIHIDQMNITRHPIERGAEITDHAFKRPASVRIRAGWAAPHAQSELRNIYQNLLTLQAAATLINVNTGKRRYSNMLVEMVQTNTNRETENALVLDVICTQIVLVSTSTVQVPSAAVQQSPLSTAATVNQGVKQPSPVAVTTTPQGLGGP